MLTTYEAIILFRCLPKNELGNSVKRVAELIFEKDGILRQLLYMGHKTVPWRQSKNRMPFWEAHYLFYEFNVPKMKMPALSNELTRDNDIIKHTFCPRRVDHDDVRTKATTPFPKLDFDACTFEDEMAPVPYRPKVIQLVDLAKRIKKNKERKHIKLNLGCDFYPFQR